MLCIAATAVSVAVMAVTAAPIAAPIDTIRALDSKLQDCYNARDFECVASAYNPGADIVPPSADTFVKGSDAVAFFQSVYESGVTGLTIEPVNVVAESDTLYHEIGNISHALQPAGGLYYCRWFRSSSTSSDWQIAFDSMAISEPWVAGGTPLNPELPESNITLTIEALDLRWQSSFNRGDYNGVAQLYNPGAQLIPPGSSEYLLQPQLADFFQTQADSGLDRVTTRRPAVTQQESATLIHEIGIVRSSSGVGTYYVRWVKPGPVWQIAFDIMSIGTRNQ